MLSYSEYAYIITSGPVSTWMGDRQWVQPAT